MMANLSAFNHVGSETIHCKLAWGRAGRTRGWGDVRWRHDEAVRGTALAFLDGNHVRGRGAQRHRVIRCKVMNARTRTGSLASSEPYVSLLHRASASRPATRAR
jgi:hypothetical protein